MPPRAPQKKNNWGQGASYTSARPVGGPGLWVTCVRGKEGKCVADMYDLLEQVADEEWPAARIERELAYAESSKTSSADHAAGPSATVPIEAAPESEGPSGGERDSDDAADEDESIEASIARELAELKQSGRGGGTGRKRPASSQDREASHEKTGGSKGKEKEREHKFLSVKTDTDCMLFISFKKPYNPVEIATSLITSVLKTGVTGARFVRRLEPVSDTCHSKSLENVKRLSDRLIGREMAAWKERNPARSSFTYKIEPSLRSHTAPLTRDNIIETLGSTLRTLATSLPSLQLESKADLKHPDVVFLPTVLKNVFGLSMVDGPLYTGRGRKFNLAIIAEEYEKARLEKASLGQETGVGPANSLEPPLPLESAAAE